MRAGGTAELVDEERSEQAIERESRYRIVLVQDPEGLNDALAA